MMRAWDCFRLRRARAATGDCMALGMSVVSGASAHARELGFAVAAIRELLAMTAEPQASCDRADGIARRHLADVDRRIGQLVGLRAELRRMIEECDHGQCQHETH